MNKSETLAFNWLLKQGIKEKNIIFSPNTVPDFTINDGRSFEVKRLYKNIIIFYDNQMKNLSDDTVILIMKDRTPEPFLQVKFKDIRKVKKYKGIKIRLVKPKKCNLKKLIDMDNNIYTDFVANCKKQSKKVGDVLNIILKKYNNEKNRK